MTTAQQATIKPLVKAMIEAWVNNQASDISASLLADYESDAALNATYVGYQVGAGAADGGTATRCNFDATINQETNPINSQNSYLRVDGPRVWIEMVVQAAVAYKSNGFVHYHSLWRDRLADYGNEFGGFLDTTSTATTYTRPTFTTQPTSVTGSSATFTSVATANSGSGAVTPTYQWYNTSAGIITGATSASYTTATAGSYYVTATTAYGTTASNTVTFTPTATVPSITTQPTSQTVVLGGSVTFSVAATGTGTLSYQWYFGGVAISGATGSSYTIATTTDASAGSYYAIVTNSAGSTTSATVTLTITQPYDAFLSTYGLTGASATADSDGDGISNLLEFVLGGNPTVSNTSILPTATRDSSGNLVFSFYATNNLGDVSYVVEYTNDLTVAYTTATDGTNGVTITSTAYTTASNLVTVTLPASLGSPLFARLRATLTPTTAGSATTSSAKTDALSGRTSQAKVRSKK